ncbi:MAG TPA: RDD family protein [Flavobacteriaceae bacterium]|nr:RDD family protein [Flavobacteriaceae bacterium]
MDKFQIETAQNVNIFQNVAGVGERILAYLIDGFIHVIYVIAAVWVINKTEIFDYDDHFFLIMMTLGLPVAFYHLLFETFWNGQSPGKKIMKIRVVKIDGSKPQFSNYLLRWLLRIIDVSLLFGVIGLVTVLLNGKGQRLGDLAAATTVISEKKTTDFSQILLADISDEYTPTYPQVTVFSDIEMQNIKQIYATAKRNNNHFLILKLSEKAAQVMEVSFEEKPIEFMDKIIKDYTFYTQNL